MAGYIGTKAVLLSTTAATVTGDAEIAGDLTVDTNTLFVDSTNNRVGVGTSSPNAPLHLVVSDATLYSETGAASLSSYMRILNDSSTTGTLAGIELGSKNDAGALGLWHIGSVSTSSNYDNDLVFHARTGSGTYAERMRIDSSGNLLINTPVENVYNQTTYEGVAAKIDNLQVARFNDTCVFLNRIGTQGDIIDLRSDGLQKGRIGYSGDVFIAAETISSSVRIVGNIAPWSDNFTDVGTASRRWDDVYATNGTIQTSDANEKQQIAELTAAEMQAAKAISKLFKTFKWNDSVAEKGDAARIHSGVIAQEVEAAMADAGLDASKYAFFISSTWWESTEVIPAVEEVLDEEGNVVTEAQAERTVTQTYQTAEEAPEGAVERTRKGIRYPQLLSFIGAATEQRLASIEARLDALEVN